MFIMDAHCDTLMDVVEGRRRLADKDRGGQLDLPRMMEAGVSAQIFAIYVSKEYLPGGGARRALQFVDAFYREIEDNSDKLIFATTGSDVDKAREEGKIAAFLSIEGGEALDGRIELLRIFYRLGVRLMTLTWSLRNELADGAFEGRTGGGLTRFGVDVVEEMDRLGMVVDVSHLSEAGFWDVMKVSKRPIVASHSNSKELCSHPRNLTDDQVKAIAKKGRSVGLTYSQTMRYIIFPQAFRRIIPPLGNEFIAMLKDSSLVSVIALEDLLRKGQVVITRTFRPFEVYMVVALIYLVMTFAISRLVAWSEKRLKVLD
jgi:membrane dipeptidase